MKRVTGLGGVFFRSKDPKALASWYKDRLGLPMEPWGGVCFKWRDGENPDKPGTTVWSPFAENTEYFGPGNHQWMINYRVDDLDAVLEALKAEGVEVLEKREDSEYGRFGWIVDPEGNRIELWQPPEGQ